MARAKRTDRAELRRRYRAQLLQLNDAEAEASTQELISPARSASRSAKAAPVRPGQTIGWGEALKSATRPVHYIDDLKFAPTLIFRTKAIWPAALVSVAALLFALTRTDAKDPTLGLLVVYALPIPALLQPMLAGFLAPRATWLAGLIASVISGACSLIMLSWFTSGHLSSLPEGVSKVTLDGSAALQALLASATFGALLGAGSAWYKRFLTAKGGLFGPPPRGGTQRPSQRPAPKRSTARR